MSFSSFGSMIYCILHFHTCTIVYFPIIGVHLVLFISCYPVLFLYFIYICTFLFYLSYTLCFCILLLLFLYIHVCNYLRSGYGKLCVPEGTITVQGSDLCRLIPEGIITVRDSDLCHMLSVPEGTITVRSSDLCLLW